MMTPALDQRKQKAPPPPVLCRSDGGQTWSERPTAGKGDWQHVACSGDASVISALAGGVYLSGDSGATWKQAPLPANKAWQASAVSADGRTLVVVGGTYDGPIAVSSDGGLTWS